MSGSAVARLRRRFWDKHGRPPTPNEWTKLKRSFRYEIHLRSVTLKTLRIRHRHRFVDDVCVRCLATRKERRPRARAA